MLRDQLGERRLGLTDDQRRRLAAKAKGLARCQRPRGLALGEKLHLAMIHPERPA